MHLRIGTRRSPLAMAQTNHVMGLIREKFPETEFTLCQIATIADRDRVSEFHQFGMVGVFAVEHEQQLVRREVDFVVHSLKDLPTTLHDGLVLASVPPREDPRDALCGVTMASLRQGARVGTGSLRRRAQILNLRPDVTVVPIRGNVGPRLAKIGGEDALDAVILAQAGLRRLGLDEASSEVLASSLFPYAVGQGALGLEARADDAAVIEILQAIQCPKTRAEVEAEREMMHALGAGCSLPVGACASWEGDRLTLHAQVTSVDGAERVVASDSAAPEQARELGLAVAEILKERGGGAILEKSYRGYYPTFKTL
ncbi:hydroxymethylbilane synthase [Bosea sp. NBC_00550]|uniref:hydroxymethylbilane synthase n=1 Tax=Bosea sp. NBC_00550 TaxID=2969621 RepID=UPI00223260F5|nr:hydroxymethylbilane synthase [Bosea sp. NBC_00550]UZF92369.1 hydroxymethylbilane synthase [Bosea sp. NBC_00550]